MTCTLVLFVFVSLRLLRAASIDAFAKVPNGAIATPHIYLRSSVVFEINYLSPPPVLTTDSEQVTVLSMHYPYPCRASFKIIKKQKTWKSLLNIKLSIQ